MSLSNCIRLTRQKALLTQDGFAEALQVSLVSVNRWETGRAIPNLKAMKAIKSFCIDNDLDYDLIEKEWLSERNNIARR